MAEECGGGGGGREDRKKLSAFFFKDGFVIGSIFTMSLSVWLV